MSQMKEFILGLQSIIKELPRDEDGNLNYALYVSINDYLSQDSLEFRFTLSWSKGLDFKICSDSWWRRKLCYLAHGDTACGGREYVILEEKVKSVYKQIVQYSKKGVFKECKISGSWDADKEILGIFMNVKIRVPKYLLSDETASLRKQTYEQLLKVMKERGCGFISEERDSDLFFYYKESLYREVGPIHEIRPITDLIINLHSGYHSF